MKSSLAGILQHETLCMTRCDRTPKTNKAQRPSCCNPQCNVSGLMSHNRPSFCFCRSRITCLILHTYTRVVTSSIQSLPTLFINAPTEKVVDLSDGMHIGMHCVCALQCQQLRVTMRIHDMTLPWVCPTCHYSDCTVVNQTQDSISSKPFSSIE